MPVSASLPTEVSVHAKRAYVSTARAVRLGLIGVGAGPSRYSGRGRAGKYAASLLSIYDVKHLAELDVPWWTFWAADQVDWFLAGVPNPRVFEYGSGASTLWLSKRAAEVYSVEHDERFAKEMQRVIPSHASITVPLVPLIAADQVGVRSGRHGEENKDFTEYVHSIDTVEGMFDVIVVDGRVRSECLLHSMKRLAPGGIIVFDNANRERYKAAIEESGALVRGKWGLTPCLPYPTLTALLRFNVNEREGQ